MKYIKPHLAITLACVGGAFRSTLEIWKARPRSDHEATQRALSNRLQELRAKKLVICRRVGKEKHWRLK